MHLARAEATRTADEAASGVKHADPIEEGKSED